MGFDYYFLLLNFSINVKLAELHAKAVAHGGVRRRRGRQHQDGEYRHESLASHREGRDGAGEDPVVAGRYYHAIPNGVGEYHGIEARGSMDAICGTAQHRRRANSE